ncbi:Nitroreductase [Desulfonatronum thiosulfatophilum]|uniref:Nitroreductase n=1 Tax=Desulfonatronum thiosulfatophilum TaxID=617002 RepID=A0A1G6EJU6_9BACT|nr:nitroreductase family protein [Desulfonatronum thiosulfatophilum]SDB57245.1 Nitroreductase [Desulfonatronum thiosulfatophilum]
MADNETLRTIAARHSIRMFTDQDVAPEHIQALLNAANQAPSAHNQQSWRFVVLRGQKKSELAKLAGDRAADFPKPSSSLLRMAARSINSAPVVVAILNTGELIARGEKLFKLEHPGVGDFFRTMEIQSSAAAVQNLLLAATSLGLGSVWLGILFLIKEDVRRFLGEPEGEFMAVIPLGYHERMTKGPNKIKTDVVTRYLQ